MGEYLTRTITHWASMDISWGKHWHGQTDIQGDSRNRICDCQRLKNCWLRLSKIDFPRTWLQGYLRTWVLPFLLQEHYNIYIFSKALMPSYIYPVSIRSCYSGHLFYIVQFFLCWFICLLHEFPWVTLMILCDLVCVSQHQELLTELCNPLIPVVLKPSKTIKS